MSHWECSVDVTQEPFFCSDHDVYLNDDGSEVVVRTDQFDADTECWDGAELTV